MGGRRIRFHRWGLAEDPRGLQVCWRASGRDYMADVVGVRFNEVTRVHMLQVRHFNGETAPEVSAGAVYVLARREDEEADAAKLRASRQLEEAAAVSRSLGDNDRAAKYDRAAKRLNP